MDTSYFAYPWKKNHHSPAPNEVSLAGSPVTRNYIIINLNKNAEKFLPDVIEEVKHRYKKGYEIMYVPIAKGKGSQYDDMQYAHKIQQ